MSIFKSAPANISDTLCRLTPHESKSFLRRAKFSGDPVILNNQPFTLNAKYLDKIGLTPVFATEFAGLEIAFTAPFAAGNYTATLAFVRSDRQTLIASYYYDPIRGFWYYLPDYFTSKSSNSSPIERPGKGYRLESLRLPTALQITLNQLAAQPHAELSPSSALFSLAGTAKHYHDHTGFLESLRSGALANHPYYSHIQPKPVLRLDGSLPKDPQPTELTLEGPSAPNFTTLQPAAYHVSNIFYPDITVDLCDSADGNYQYNFCRVAKDQTTGNQASSTDNYYAWLGAVEAKSPITPLGLAEKWVALGSFGTPLYLDALHASEYGDTSDRRHGHYLNMWPKYLAKAPYVQTYLAAISHNSE